MIRTFDRDGVRFQYPSNWKVETDEQDEAGWTITVSGPDTAFMIVSLRPDALDASTGADDVLEVFKTEYKEIDVEPAMESIANSPAIGYDLDFLTLDFAVVARIRALDTTEGVLVVLSQVTERDRVKLDPVLRAMVASLVLPTE